MGDQSTVREAIVGNLAGDHNLTLDGCLPPAQLNGYLHTFSADNLKYVQVKAFCHNICKVVSHLTVFYDQKQKERS